MVISLGSPLSSRGRVGRDHDTGHKYTQRLLSPVSAYRFNVVCLVLTKHRLFIQFLMKLYVPPHFHVVPMFFSSY